MKRVYLLPLTVLLLALALAALGWRARSRRGHLPLALGMSAAVVVLAGRFALASNLTVYAGTAMLVGASAWNAWPVRRAEGQTCPGPHGPAV
ncbi:MAG: hypothetical protein M1274_09445 [Actinobacteria bacterium]|nr:hypothetical protein [Actinomycetota bacterium]